MKIQVYIIGLLILFSQSLSAVEEGRNNLEKLKACPDKPNCVSSEETSERAQIEPLVFSGEVEAIPDQLKMVLADLGGQLVEEKGNYLAATFTSRIFHFVDDVEFRIDAENRLIHVRSASRVGYSDFGVNRKRVEKLRQHFSQLNNQYVELSTEAAKIIGKFVSKMQPQLKSALQSAGPAHAIDVCSVKAQEVARQLSQETGWDVTRVSLKSRNSIAGEPDAWEKAILQQFDNRQQQGEPAAQLSYAGFNDNKFRFMKAQGVMPICLNCHGENLTPEVKAALEKHYPDDKATGYKQGQVRGAFSLSKDL